MAAPPCCTWKSYKAVFFRSASVAKCLKDPTIERNEADESTAQADAHAARTDCLSAIAVDARGHVQFSSVIDMEACAMYTVHTWVCSVHYCSSYPRTARGCVYGPVFCVGQCCACWRHVRLCSCMHVKEPPCAPPATISILNHPVGPTVSACGYAGRVNSN